MGETRTSVQRLQKTVSAMVLVVSLFSGVLVLPSFAQAAPLKGYEAMAVTVTGGGKILMKPGETKQISLEFQNIGTESWDKSGQGFVSIYTYGPKYRTSVFQDTSWYKADQPTILTESEVKPSGVGRLTFSLKAPQKTGQYQETFALAAEDIAWIPGGQFTLNIVVSTDTATSPSVSVPSTTPASSAIVAPSGLSGTILIRSAKTTLQAQGGETLSYTVGIKNTGTIAWKQREVRVPDVSLASVQSDTQDTSWVSSRVLVAKADTEVAPGALDFVTFSFKAPSTKGLHTVRYVFAADGNVVPDLTIDIPVDVTSNAPEAVRSPRREEATQDDAEDEEHDYIEEPLLRVGVLIVDDETANQVVVSCEGDWELRETTGNLLAEMDGGEAVTAFYKTEKGKYYFNRGNGLETTTYPLRFVSSGSDKICTVENFDRRITRKYTHPDNTFRNVLELRYNDTKERTWLINELPIELYLRGLAETSNISHLEFQKALITVARTYALYHFERGTKRGPEGFHVTAYSDDQVYNGYGQEQRSPRLTESVEATRGRVVTYEGKTAITPYFSRSDGRTRNWSEVWYGDVAWLKGVPAPCDVGKTLWGHGVGMSASEALCQANNGKKWDEILHYFYTGVDIDRHWE